MRLWYIAAGSAFFLNQYPRMDTIHLLWSAGPLLVAGADVLYRLYRGAIAGAPALRRYQSARRALAVAIVAIPLIACLPHFYWRIADLVGPPPGARRRSARRRDQAPRSAWPPWISPTGDASGCGKRRRSRCTRWWIS